MQQSTIFYCLLTRKMWLEIRSMARIRHERVTRFAASFRIAYLSSRIYCCKISITLKTLGPEIL